ncbi:amino acid transporter [Morchella conica CCBAS932]|uniref:Amino acid transporter n=1 Tax=Morchella conica CCBAS932 TaxID=1392247 RepID=A0A3N4L3T4_9PEZI|nr:amino acid transporter [Morchella conica CCBAS932]
MERSLVFRYSLASLASSSPADTSPRSSTSSRSGAASSRRLSTSSSTNPNSPTAEHRPRNFRTYSVSSAFDFNAHLVPLTTSSDARGLASSSAAAVPGSLEKQKTLSYLNGLSLLIGLQIGSGIFSSPSQVNNHVPSPGVALIVWAVAGVLAWTGAASYAELGGAIPLNGGSGVYLRHCFGELAGFLYSWTAVIVLKPGSAAIIAIISGEYFNSVVFGLLPGGGGGGGGGGEGEGEGRGQPSEVANKVTAGLLLLLVTALNMFSTRLTTRISDSLLFLKVGSLLAITVIGIVVAATGLNGDGKGASREWREMGWFESRESAGGAYAIALYAGLWAFDGWDNVNFVTGEMKNAKRDLPRVIHSAMPIVIASYLLANVAYYLVLPASTISQSNTIAVAFGTKVFGRIGGLVFALTVSLSCFGALNATTFTSGRLIYAAGKEGYLPPIFGTLGLRPPPTDIPRPTRLPPSSTSTPSLWSRTLSRIRPRSASSASSASAHHHPQQAPPWSKTPIYAMLLNATITCLYIAAGEFGTLLTFYGVAGYTFYFLTVLGLVVLRVKEPALERSYRTWVSTPIVFCCVSLFLVSRSVFGRPVQTLVVCAFVAAGVPVYCQDTKPAGGTFDSAFMRHAYTYQRNVEKRGETWRNVVVS